MLFSPGLSFGGRCTAGKNARSDDILDMIAPGFVGISTHNCNCHKSGLSVVSMLTFLTHGPFGTTALGDSSSQN